MIILFVRGKEQEALGKGGIRLTPSALDVVAGASTFKRAVVVLVPILPAALENVKAFLFTHKLQSFIQVLFKF